MHIPDGLLSTPVWVSLDAVAVGTVACSAKVVEKRLGEQQVPALAIVGAFLFAAQMINFPVAGGTSGHLMGGALAAILLGPWAAVLVMATVLGIQALVFQDGGLTVLGANFLNMGVIGALSGYAVYRLAGRLLGEGGRAAAAFAAGWVSLMLAALATALELVLSGMAASVVVFPAMLGVHAVIGVGEGLITAGAVLALARTRPDLLALEKV